MSEQSEFEKWLNTTLRFDGESILLREKNWAKRGWQACAERNKKGVEFLTASIENETRVRRQLEIENAALREENQALEDEQSIFEDAIMSKDKELVALREFAIWLTGCGYDFTQHQYFLDNRHLLIGDTGKTE